MKTTSRVSVPLALTLWLVCDILLFRFSRAGLWEYAMMLVAVPATLGTVLALAWRFDSRLSLNWWGVFRAGLWSKLITFHWYVIPIVYRFEQRDEWLLEIGHHVFTLVIQFAVISLVLRIWKRTQRPHEARS